VYPLGVLLALALHIANALPDDEVDRRAGVRGLVQRLGTAWAVRLLLGCYWLALVIGFALVLSEPAPQAAVILGTIAGGALGGWATTRAISEPRARVVFGALAVGCGLLAISVVAAITPG
jgi:4-hydroxybenzoate polyprenyltransferase